VFAGVPQEEVLEVRAADTEDELVGGEVVIPARDCHIDELLLVAKVLCKLKETLVVVLPAQHQAEGTAAWPTSPLQELERMRAQLLKGRQLLDSTLLSR